MQDAVEVILTTFVGRRKELELRDKLAARVASVAPLLSQAQRAKVAAATTSGMNLQRDHAAASSSRMTPPTHNIGPMALPRSVTLSASYSAVAPTLAQYARLSPSAASSVVPLGSAQNANITPLQSTVELTDAVRLTPPHGSPRQPGAHNQLQLPAVSATHVPQTPRAPPAGATTATPDVNRCQWSPTTLESSANQLAAAAAALRQRTPTPSRNRPHDTSAPTPREAHAATSSSSMQHSEIGGAGDPVATWTSSSINTRVTGNAAEATMLRDVAGCDSGYDVPHEGSDTHSPPTVPTAPASSPDATPPTQSGSVTRGHSAGAVGGSGAKVPMASAAGPTNESGKGSPTHHDLEVDCNPIGNVLRSGALAAVVQEVLNGNEEHSGSENSYESATSGVGQQLGMAVQS